MAKPVRAAGACHGGEALPIDGIKEILGERTTSQQVPIPLACRDGFNEAYYGRPEMLLDKGAREACSAWSFVDEATASSYLGDLTSAIASGSWDMRYGHFRSQSVYMGSLRLIVNTP